MVRDDHDTRRARRRPSAPAGRAPRRTRSVWRWVLVGVGALVLVAAAVVLWPNTPTLLNNAVARVESADASVAVTSGAGTASIVVPAGWVLSQPPVIGGTTVRSPDGVLQLTVEVVTGSPQDAVASHVSGVLLTESTPAGAVLVHGSDADASDATWWAAVGPAGNGATGPSVLVRAEANGADLDVYRDELAAFLAAVQVAA